MKLYKNLAATVASVLHQVLDEGGFADKVLERTFRGNPQWGSRDRRFVAECVYDIIRYRRLYSAIADSQRNYWLLLAAYLVEKEIELPDWPEWRHADPRAFAGRKRQALKNEAVAESYPDWLWELGEKELDGGWPGEAHALNGTAPVFLRVNTLKANRAKAASALAEENIETSAVTGAADALMLTKRSNIFKTRAFREGLVEVQDAGSQEIAPLLGARAGETIIDACAGAGGKTLHLAALMGNKGRVVAMDVEAWKLDELKKRARRAGAFNIETMTSTPEAVKKLSGKADRLLLDVPCSGLGVLKRNPDAKWKLSPESIQRTRQLQQEILSTYSSMVRNGGTLVYSTCSILPSENQQQVASFLSTAPFRLRLERTLLPSNGTDGFYMAVMERA